MDCPTGTDNKSHFGEVTLVKMWSLLENGLYVTQLASPFLDTLPKNQEQTNH